MTVEAIEPEELGSGEVKWECVETPDGWNKVTNEGGVTLGFDPDSGVQLLQVDGFAFKDLDKDVIKVAAENITKSIGSIVTMAVNSTAKPAKAAAATSTQQTAGATKPATPVSTRAVSGNNAGNVPESGDVGSVETRVY